MFKVLIFKCLFAMSLLLFSLTAAYSSTLPVAPDHVQGGIIVVTEDVVYCVGVSPNPSTDDNIYCHVLDSEDEIREINLINADFQVVFQGYYASGEAMFSVATQPAGEYVLMIRTASCTIRKKVQIIK